MLPLHRLLCFIFLSLLSAACVHAFPVEPGGEPRPGVYSSMTMVEGRPAIAYSYSFLNSVKYVRATDAGGTAWGTPVMVALAWASGYDISLVIVNGNPAVCYRDDVNGKIKFARATDTTGTAWGAPVVVNIGNSVAFNPSIAVVDGKPAICFRSLEKLAYVRATDANGTAWGQVKALADMDSFPPPSMAVVDGRPAIVFCSGSQLFFIRAADATGNTWGPLVNVEPGRFSQHSPSLQVVNGRPALAYHDGERGLTYVRALDAAGTAWGAPLSLDTFHNAGMSPVLSVVNGKPAIAYFSFAANNGRGLHLRYVQARDSDGGTAAAWDPAFTVYRTGFATNNFGVQYTDLALLEVEGRPAVSCHDANSGSLQFLRSAVPNQNGVPLWPPDVMVEVGPDAILPEGFGWNFGIVPVGTKASFDFILSNPSSGSAPLTIHDVTFDGPDAAEFSVTVRPQQTLVPGDTTLLTVQYAPVTPGAKSADLHILSNAEGPRNNYRVFLLGDSQPDIQVEQPADQPVEESQERTLPLTPAGHAADFVFTIKNPGGANLTGLAVSIDGPDAAEFSIFAPPAAQVPPGGRTTFTLRHVPRTAGRKSAALHIASNMPGDWNPFDIPVTMEAGTLDKTFACDSDARMNAVAVQADGKILTGGANFLSRFNPDGTTDLSFFEPSISGGTIERIVVQKDGKILAGGSFQQVNGKSRPGLVRLLADGSLDTSFAPGAMPGVHCMAVQPNGDILVGGTFTSVGEHALPRLARIHPDGSPDTTFQPGLSGPGGMVLCIALQPDGNILIGGHFFTVGAAADAYNFARLRPDGTLDMAPSALAGAAYSLAVLTDGRILVAGSVGAGRTLVQLLPDGTLDPTFDIAPAGPVFDMALQADGKCLVAGDFGNFGIFTRLDLARFNADNTVDPGFDSAAWRARRVTLRADGKVLVTGDFPMPGFPRNIARLDSDPAFVRLKRENATTLRWMRSGSAPEVRDVTFDLQLEGSPDWTRLGTAARIPGGWELSGLTLPASGRFRAQAFAGGSVIEATAPLLSPLESWRLQYFNTPSSTGDAANDADPDHDGLTNFTEFAFGLNPVDRASSTLPEFKHNGASFTTTFTAPEGRNDILYGTEWSPTMLPGTWTPVPDTGTAPVHSFSATADQRVFVRFRLGVQ